MINNTSTLFNKGFTKYQLSFRLRFLKFHTLIRISNFCLLCRSFLVSVLRPKLSQIVTNDLLLLFWYFSKWLLRFVYKILILLIGHNSYCVLMHINMATLVERQLIWSCRKPIYTPNYFDEDNFVLEHDQSIEQIKRIVEIERQTNSLSINRF